MVIISIGIISFIFLIFQMVVLATVIDMGNAAVDGPDASPVGYTLVDKINPSTAKGKITSVEIWANTSMTNCEVAIFFNPSGDNLTTRATQLIGNVVAGAKRTFEVDLDVEIGDYIGVYTDDGKIDYSYELPGAWYVSGDKIPCTLQGFTGDNDFKISLRGIGTTVEEVKKKNVIFMGSNF